MSGAQVPPPSSHSALRQRRLPPLLCRDVHQHPPALIGSSPAAPASGPAHRGCRSLIGSAARRSTPTPATPRSDWPIAHVSLGTSRRVFAQMGTFPPPQRYWGSNWEDTGGNWEHWASPLPPAQGRTLLTSLQPRPRARPLATRPAAPTNHRSPLIPTTCHPISSALSFAPLNPSAPFFPGRAASGFRPRRGQSARGAGALSQSEDRGRGFPVRGPVPPLPHFGGPGAPPGTKRPQKGPKMTQNDPEPPNRLTPAPAIY